MKKTIKQRPAFTLVELLVAAGIIAMLLALVAISYPSINEREQLTRAVDKLRTGLLTARLWARRDNVVTGVRFEQDTSTNPPKWGYYFTQQPLLVFSGFVSDFNKSVDPRKITVEFDKNSIDRGANFSKIKPIEFNIDYKEEQLPLWPTGSFPALPDNHDIFYNYRNRKNPTNDRHDSIILEGDVPHRIVYPRTTSGTSGELVLESSIQINVQYKHLFRVIRNLELVPLQEFSGFDSSISNLEIKGFKDLTISFLPNGQVLNSPANQLTLELTQKQISPNADVEIARVFLDCISGTTRYTNP